MNSRSAAHKGVNNLKAENAELKAENKKLAKQTQEKKDKKRSKTLNLLQRSAVIFFVALAVALLTIGNLFFWVGNTVVKQDRWVAATEPLIKDTEVQKTLALYTTNKLYEQVDVQSIIQEVLPPRADFLAPQLSSQLNVMTKLT
jgi:chromosome condensin MukBEF MukE localization factor